MVDEQGRRGFRGEEIQGAPPVASPAELRERRLVEAIKLNRYLYLQTQQFEHMLLDAHDLQALLEVLLVSLPRHFAFRSAELWLHDPDGILAELIVGGERYGHFLQLHGDAFEMQELYGLEPDIDLVDATDSRMFEVLKSEHGIDYALLLPLTESGRLLGSLHVGIADDMVALGGAEESLLAHLAAMIARCLTQAVSHQQVSRLTMLDSLTLVSNARGFELDLGREIARAKRADKPVTLLMIEIDEYDDLYQHYGEGRARFVLKRVAQRISSDLRATDMMARLKGARMAVLIPGSGESLASDIAERMRQDIEAFSIDDGRGAVLQVTIGIGLVTWEPSQYPAVDMDQLARQMESVGLKAQESACAKGGNTVVLSRLATLLV
ncbi:GGDEF domain-containing protein [Pseudohalioglobus lutimaris]|uniref:diguanylate cyclase n=1 Tax=Pseudohalioglobus lutimaris TaxID=1737061 RepID=A0A2N5X770_9GAMM|nr:GGDEF domain-containing protein [Pseudohalioglobus lutimaris]PLW70343.1 GGDEF domain-containing protein [Pseudohalioglobus lutimaris]